MTFAEALRAARRLIASGEYRFICHALSKVHGRKYRSQINRQLQRCVYYEHWVAAFHPDSYRRMTGTDFRAGRLQWIDHMIEQEEKAGRA